MSLELFSPLSNVIPDDELKSVVFYLEHEFNYSHAYVSKKGRHGFIYKGECYDEKESPLFEIAISDAFVILSVFGGLNEQECIKKDVSYAFNMGNISVNFFEE